MFSEFTKERDRERPNFLRAIPGLGIGAGTALNVADRDRSKSKLGPGCVAVDGEEICGSGSLGFAEAVESGDCNQSDSPRTTIACRKRLAAVKELAIDCKIGKTYQALVNEGESERHIPNAVLEQILKKLPSCPNGGNILVDVLYTRWDYSSQSFKMRLEESERALVSKLNKAVMTACSALRPTVADRDVLSPENRESTVLTEFLYRCAVVAGGSLSPYSWKTKAADIALLRREQSDRRAADAETRAENAARPSAAAFCSGHITAKCMSRCIKAKLCR